MSKILFIRYILKTFITMRKFAVIIGSAVTMLAASCSSLGESPYLYTKEIDDAVKFYVAEVDYFIAAANSLPKENGADVISTYDDLCEYDDDMMGALDEIYVGDDDITYKEVLERVSVLDGSRYAVDAADILERYNAVKIDLSKYERNDVKSGYENWVFVDKNSGIKFIFELATESGKKVWNCYPDEESYMEYINDRVEETDEE